MNKWSKSFNIKDKILDASIFYSFDASGFARHKTSFTDENNFNNLESAIVTGGTSGIGLATATELAKAGVHVIITGRNTEKGNMAASTHPNLDFVKLDLSNWEDIKNFTDKFSAVQALVLNAGGMPEKLNYNKNGIETQFASQLFGHYHLLRRLSESRKLKDKSPVVWVSSGGMYLKPLQLEPISKISNTEDGKYDKVDTYANVKRAQVTILPELQREFESLRIFAMHPGWVDTPAVRNAIPGFYKKMKNRLRTPAEGADTILWLVSHPQVPSGFYFDRKKVKSHFFWHTRKSDKLKTELYKKIQESYE